MRGLFTNSLTAMPAGQVLSGIAGRAQALRVQHGRVWITVEGIPHDYFLRAGDSFTAVPGRLTVVEAEQDTQITQIPVRRPHARFVLDALGRRLGALAGRLSGSGTVEASLQRHRPCDAC